MDDGRLGAVEGEVRGGVGPGRGDLPGALLGGAVFPVHVFGLGGGAMLRALVAGRCAGSLFAAGLEGVGEGEGEGACYVAFAVAFASAAFELGEVTAVGVEELELEVVWHFGGFLRGECSAWFHH